jgi:predicted metal-dependent enzyme (double-stranded beta helix superfamily)
MLRGAEKGYRYKRLASGELVSHGAEAVLYPGEIEAVSPLIGDIHEVANAIPDKSSISIHVYGANIGAVKRHIYDPLNGNIKNFISGYSSQQVPNLWDRSAEIRASL